MGDLSSRLLGTFKVRVNRCCHFYIQDQIFGLRDQYDSIEEVNKIICMLTR